LPPSRSTAERFTCAPAEDFLYLPSRIEPAKRQLLVIEALGLCRAPVRVRFSGLVNDAGYRQRMAARIGELGLAARVDWRGVVGEEEKRDSYARSLGVLFPPVDEDYGYVTLEAMLARKPVITCTDSGGPLEFVIDGATGLVTPPTPAALAAAMDRLWQDRAQSARWGEAGRAQYDARRITWQHVVDTLTREH
jgi:glycosyltransferase involved in cell wall biosynthesis